MFRRRFYFHHPGGCGCLGCGGWLFFMVLTAAAVIYFLIWFLSRIIH